MKLKKKLIKIGGVLLLIVTIGTSIFCYKVNKDNEKALSIVQNGKSKINTETNYKKAFEKYLTNVSWNTYKTSDGVRIVGFTGKKHLKDRDNIVTYHIEYIVNEDNNTFEFYKGNADGINLNAVEILSLTIQAMGSYDSANNY